MTKHIDTLAEWWENAEEGVINEGDRLIYRDEDNYDFRIAKREDAGQAAEKEHEHGWAILDRAPAPKPAWHDAVAVIAQTPGRDDRRVFIRDTDGWWADVDNSYEKDELSDVTPLIEQKVTQPMIDRARAESMKWDFGGLSGNAVDSMLTAALGLDPA